MKQLLIAVFLFLSVKSFAQDSTHKTVFVFDTTITVQVPTLIYKSDNNIVKWSSPGYNIYQGRAYREGKEIKWYSQPSLIGSMDDKKRKVQSL